MSGITSQDALKDMPRVERGGGGGISSIVEDTTPQLGGDLDLNGKNIDFPTTANISDCLDEDNMASDSATVLATQQSIKKYVDDNVGGGSGSWIKIGTVVASNDATLTITGLDSTYDTYAIAISDLVPIDDGVSLKLRVGDSGGVDAGTDYVYHAAYVAEGATAYAGDNSAGTNAIVMAVIGVGNQAGEGVGAILYLTRPGDGTMWPVITGTYTMLDGTSATLSGGFVHGARNAVITLDRIQILFSSGNLSTGRLTVWGISHA